MWNSPKNVTPEYQIRDEHIRILKVALEDSYEYDISDRKDVLKALDYLEDVAPWGVSRFRRGLRNGERMKLIEGIVMIRAFV